MKTKEDIDFKNLEKFISIPENRNELYDHYTLLHYLEEESQILYFLDNWNSRFLFRIDELKLINLKILNKINEKHFLNLEALLTIEWGKVSHQDFINFVKDYVQEDGFKKNHIISLIPVLELSKIRAVRNLFPFSYEDFIKIMKVSYNFHTNRYAMQNEQFLLSKTKIGSIWEIEKQGLLGFIEELEIKISRFTQNDIYLYLKEKGIDDDLGLKSISSYHFAHSSSENFISIMKYVKEQSENEIQYISCLSDMLTGHYLNTNLTSKSMRKKIAYLITEIHNCDPFETRKIYHSITNSIILEAFININNPFYAYFDYEFSPQANKKLFNAKLIKVLNGYDILNWKGLRSRDIDTLLSNILYKSSNKEKQWEFEDIKLVVEKLLSENETNFLKEVLDPSKLNELTEKRTDILNLITNKYYQNMINHVAIQQKEKYNDKSKIFIAKMEKDAITKNVEKNENSLNTKRRI